MFAFIQAHKIKTVFIGSLLSLCITSSISAVELKVSVENLSSTDGLYLTPVWVGFHNGAFDLYDYGSAASAGLERIAEDGDPSVLRSEFMAAAPAGSDGVIFGPAGFAGAPIIDPGEVTSAIFNVDGSVNKYFSYASMVVPSNDAFIGNENAFGVKLFNAAGDFTGPIDILVLGLNVNDVGTEVNNEIDAAFLNQATPNTGVFEGGFVQQHAGFYDSFSGPGGIPLILGGTNGAGIFFDPMVSDFTRDGFQLARISISQVPEPSSIALFALGLLGLRGIKKIRKNGVRT